MALMPRMFSPRGLVVLLPLLLSLSCVLACESADTCERKGGEEQSASLLQSASTKRKVVFETGEERVRAQVGEAASAARRSSESAAVRATPGPALAAPRGALAEARGPLATPDGERAAPVPPRAAPEEAARAALKDAPPSESPEKGLGEPAQGVLARNDTGTVIDAVRAALLEGSRGAARKIRVALRSASSSSFLPVALVLIGLVLCLGLVAAGLYAAFAPAAKQGPRAVMLPNMEPAWRRTMLQTQSPGTPPARRLTPEAASRVPGTSPLPDPTPVQSMLSVVRSPPGPHAAHPDAQQGGSFLCPGLVVPEECECSLLVPRLDPQPTPAQISVDDAARVPVFRVMHCLPSRSDASPVGRQASSQRLDQDGNKCLVLSSSADDHTVFAFCRLGLNGALTILDSSEKPFGLIRARVGKTGFEVATRLGSQIHLTLTENNDLAATDRRGRTLAVTETVPGDALHRMVRIGPFVDAGLITLALLAVDLLEAMPASG